MINSGSFRFTVSILSIAGLAVIAGCSKEKVSGSSQLTAAAGNDLNVLVGSKADLNGNGSSDLSGNTFEFSWKFITKPSSSNAILENSSSATPSFIPDIQGKYKLELTVSNTMEDRDTVTVSAFEVTQVQGNYENLIPGSNVGVRKFALACGYLIATCEFTEIGGVEAHKIARYNGSAWSAMGCGLDDGSIYGMIEYNGYLYVTGQFSEIGCIGANNIARWNCDQNLWEEVAGGLTGGDNPFGYSLEIYNNELYVGGQFNKAGDVSATNIAKWDGSAWYAVGDFEGGSVRSLKVYGQKLFAGGFFTGVNGIPTGQIAAYDGNNWSMLGSYDNLEHKATGAVRHMAVYKNLLYISGDFSDNNSDYSELVTWDGQQFNDFGSAFSLYENTISELSVINGILYIGGTFTNVVGSQANNIIQWNGTTWGIMSQGVNGTVLSVILFDNKIYIGGDYDSAGGNQAENISIWTAG